MNIMLIYSKENESVIIDNNIVKNYSSTLLNLLNKLCLLNGSSIFGRMDSFKLLTNTRNKPGIYVNSEHLMFPTRSIYSSDCVLINYFLLKRIKIIDSHKTLIVFNNNYSFIVNEDYRLLKKQIKRCECFIKRIKFQNKELML